MNIVYSLKNYNVYKVGDDYIIHNTNKPWKDSYNSDNNGHTHVEHKKTAIWLCELAVYKRIPRTKCLYFYKSLIRISDDEIYTRKLQEMYDVKLKKQCDKKYYYNVNRKGKN
jgi:hypothetical protein